MQSLKKNQHKFEAKLKSMVQIDHYINLFFFQCNLEIDYQPK